MKLHQLNQHKDGKYTTTTAPTGSGKTWETALLCLRKLAESQAQTNGTSPKRYSKETNASQ